MGSSRKAEAARTNGAKGGRPRKPTYEDVFADIDEPPDDPLAIVGWMQRVVATATQETIQGRGNRELNQEVRAFANVIARLVPYERVLEAEKRILERVAPPKPQAAQRPELVTCAKKWAIRG